MLTEQQFNQLNFLHNGNAPSNPGNITTCFDIYHQVEKRSAGDRKDPYTMNLVINKMIQHVKEYKAELARVKKAEDDESLAELARLKVEQNIPITKPKKKNK